MSTTIEHLWAHIQQSTDAQGSIANLPFFRAHQPELTAQDVQSVTDALHMAWATEYALRASAELGHDEGFMRDALHWSLPQACHCINFTLRAFMFTLGVRSNNPALLQREVGRLVVKNAYPRALSFYAVGGYGDFSVHRLPFYAWPSSVLFEDNPKVRVQNKIGDALFANRKSFAQKVRLDVQANPNTAIRTPKTGKPLGQWKAEHWQQITWRLGYTTWASLLSELRMEQDSPELAAYAKTITDCRAFHEALVGVVSTINAVHEAYCAKALGEQAYDKIVFNLPPHLFNSFPEKRFAHHLTAISQATA